MLKFEEAYEIYKEVVLAGWRAGADLVKFATMTDLYEIKSSGFGGKRKHTSSGACFHDV